MITEQLNPNTEVQYDHQAHKYYLGDVIYRSATQIVGEFVNEFDVEERSEYMAHRYGNTSEYWKQKWDGIRDLACARGNLIHSQKEDFLHNRGFDLLNGKVFQVYNTEHPVIYEGWKTYGYQDLGDGVYPEMKLWRHDWHIAGRCDKPIIETILGHRYMHIDDYKTNKALTKESFHDPKTGPRMMKGPLSHLQDSIYNHYSLQLSLYQFMGEYFGFRPGKRRLIHYGHEIEGLGTPDPVVEPVPYLRTEVISMLTHLKHIGWLA